MEDSYRETVSDTEREEQGKEWCEALIDDTSEMADSSRPGGIEGLSSRQLGDFNREARAGRPRDSRQEFGATSGLKTDD